MRYYANQLNFMLALQVFAMHLLMRALQALRALRARMQKTMRRHLWLTFWKRPVGSANFSDSYIEYMY